MHNKAFIAKVLFFLTRIVLTKHKRYRRQWHAAVIFVFVFIFCFREFPFIFTISTPRSRNQNLFQDSVAMKCWCRQALLYQWPTHASCCPNVSKERNILQRSQNKNMKSLSSHLHNLRDSRFSTSVLTSQTILTGRSGSEYVTARRKAAVTTISWCNMTLEKTA
jgi:hypothetical protein